MPFSGFILPTYKSLIFFKKGSLWPLNHWSSKREEFIKYGSTEKCKENGKLRIEGKDYIVKDGDVLYFRVNPWPNLLHT